MRPAFVPEEVAVGGHTFVFSDGVDYLEEMCGFGRAVSARVDPAHLTGFF